MFIIWLFSGAYAGHAAPSEAILASQDVIWVLYGFAIFFALVGIFAFAWVVKAFRSPTSSRAPAPFPFFETQREALNSTTKVMDGDC